MNRQSPFTFIPVLLSGALLVACGEPAPPAGPAAAAAADVADAGSGDAAYLAQLGLIRGHLQVGMELYRQGLHEHAKRHMKHPEDELYASLVDDFERRGATGFADELASLAALVERDAEAAAVDAAYAALLARIDAAEARVAAPADAALHGRVAASLLGTAAEEYALGVIDGRVSNVHEYQDAYGFTQVAIGHVARAGNGEAAAAVRRQVEELAPLWPELAPEGSVDGDAASIVAARQRVERELE